MQQEVIAQNNERARVAEQSRQAEVAARHAHDVQEDKIKILCDQMKELLSRLDQEARHRMRPEEQNDSVRAGRDQRIETINIGTPARLPETRRESPVPEKPVLSSIFPEEGRFVHLKEINFGEMMDLLTKSPLTGLMVMMTMMTMILMMVTAAIKTTRRIRRKIKDERSPEIVAEGALLLPLLPRAIPENHPPPRQTQSLTRRQSRSCSKP